MIRRIFILPVLLLFFVVETAAQERTISADSVISVVSYLHDGSDHRILYADSCVIQVGEITLSIFSDKDYQKEPLCKESIGPIAGKCDLFLLPLIRKVVKLEEGKYALLGYVNNSPISIKHIWVIDVSAFSGKAGDIGKAAFVCTGGKKEIVFDYDGSETLQLSKSTNKIATEYVYIVEHESMRLTEIPGKLSVKVEYILNGIEEETKTEDVEYSVLITTK